MSERYEVLFIVRPDVGEAGMKEQADRARQVLEQQGATEITVHDWGTRDLAYRIEGHIRGAYVLIEYESMPPAVLELERTLKLSDQVLRYMSVRQAEGMAVPVSDPAEAGTEAPGDGVTAPAAAPPTAAPEPAASTPSSSTPSSSTPSPSAPSPSTPTPPAADPADPPAPQPKEGDA